MKRLQTKHIAHLIMLIFAVASLFNLQAYLDGMHHNAPLSWALGVGLAFALVVMAGLLSDLKWDFRDSKFQTILIVTIGLTVVSGAIQGSAYAKDGNVIAGYLMGFALPGLGELGIALAISAYNRFLDGREIAEAQQELARGVRRHLVDAIAQVDKSLIEAQVNKAVSKVTKELVDSVVVDMITELRGNRAQVQNHELISEQPEAQKAILQIVQNGDIEPKLRPELDAIAKMNAGKQRKIEQRRSTILNHLGDSEISVPDLAIMLGVSANTVRNDLEALQAAGHSMSINGVVKLA